MKLFVISFMTMSLLGGCATVDSSCVGNHHMVSIKNTGWKLFNVFPIASGNVEFPNSRTTLFFKDSTSLENNITILDKTIEESGATGFRNLSSSIREENILFILLNRRIYHTSAELVFDKKPTEPSATDSHADNQSR